AGLGQCWAKGGPADLSRGRVSIDEVVAELERLVGMPQRDVPLDLASPLLQALSEASGSLVVDAEQDLADVALGALGEPQFRLTGSENAVQRALWATLGHAAKQHKRLSEERREEAWRI